MYLEDCPFCGSVDVRLKDKVAECGSCGARGPKSKTVFDSNHARAEARQKWNERAKEHQWQ